MVKAANRFWKAVAARYGCKNEQEFWRRYYVKEKMSCSKIAGMLTERLAGGQFNGIIKERRPIAWNTVRSRIVRANIKLRPRGGANFKGRKNVI
jgi:hypothetical protein